MACVFCEILAGRMPAHVIYEDEFCISIMDRYPLERGHCLLIPRRHAERITDMDEAEVGSLFSRVPRIARAVLRATGASSFNVGQNNGREARQIVPHVHIHIIPRYGRAGTNWTSRQITTDEHLAGIARSIRESLGSA